MAIVFDQVDGVVQREGEATQGEAPAPANTDGEAAAENVKKKLMIAERRRERLMAD
jgi:hypothetical protein